MKIKKVFIAGDFNFDLIQAGSHHETFEFFDTMMSNFLLPVITLPTKVNRIKNTLIDNIFTNHLHPDTKSGNLEVNLSDGHLPSFLIIPRQNQNHLPKRHNIYIPVLRKTLVTLTSLETILMLIGMKLLISIKMIQISPWKFF